ncbi:Arabinitol operon repressor (plasmid) [Mycetohabitans rhizoxinica HKI 454]|uniref:Arabinitol operon repressor n=1 Tax=Mycetohabitans rhizoxinica (strain DSM 19002 / CIP 109453 / HKI 454) TaxID=882378 RepID=E5ATX2_MYCRK|nr:Arabinitol operon repressor [Mycetohabitans rhizoxinica HKI 454]
MAQHRLYRIVKALSRQADAVFIGIGHVGPHARCTEAVSCRTPNSTK